EVDSNAAEAAIQPGLGVPEHEMILRLLWVRVPRFSQCRGSLCELISITGRIGARQNVVEHVATTVFHQGHYYVMKTNIAGGNMIFMRADVSDQIFEHRRATLFGYESDCERHRVSSHAAAVVLVRPRIE